jgi:hypothetical protein
LIALGHALQGIDPQRQLADVRARNNQCGEQYRQRVCQQSGRVCMYVDCQ